MKFDPIILAPNVHVVALTQMRLEGLQDWIAAHGLQEVASEDTPLGGLLQDVTVGAMDYSLDALPEFGGRFCYRSWAKGRARPAYIDNILSERHGSVLRHSVISMAISGVSRTLSHELVRHASGTAPSQESQRYVAADAVRFVVPPLYIVLQAFDTDLIPEFAEECEVAREAYKRATTCLTRALEARTALSAQVADPTIPVVDVKLTTALKKRVNEAARAHLPGCAETRLLWTMNLQAARFVVEQRGSLHADLEIRRLAVAMCRQLKAFAPIVFADFEIYLAEDGFEATRCTHSKV